MYFGEINDLDIVRRVLRASGGERPACKSLNNWEA